MTDVEEERALVPVTGGYVDLSVLLYILSGTCQGINEKQIKLDSSALSQFIPNSGWWWKCLSVPCKSGVKMCVRI